MAKGTAPKWARGTAIRSAAVYDAPGGRGVKSNVVLAALVLVGIFAAPDKTASRTVTGYRDSLKWAASPVPQPMPQSLPTAVIPGPAHVTPAGGLAAPLDCDAASQTPGWTQMIANETGWGERSSHTSVTFNDRMWIIGGYNPDGGFQNDVWSSLDGKHWMRETQSAAWPPREGHSSEVFDNKLWVMGGNALGSRNDVWWSEDGANWT